MEKRILFITATFPPRAGSGVQRPFFQAELFSSLGVAVSVVTSSDMSTGVDSTLAPKSLCAEEIHRLPRFASRVGRLWDRALRRIGIIAYPDSFVGWALRAWWRARRIVRTSSVQSVFVSMGSPSALLAAAMIKRSNPGIRFHIDVRDLWVGSELGVADYRRSALGDALNRRLERWSFLKADSLSCVSPGMRDDLQGRYPELAGRIHVVENGYDEASFARAAGRAREPEKGVLVLRHLGTLIPTQRVVNFLEAVGELERELPEWRNHAVVDFFGGSRGFLEGEVAAVGGLKTVRAFGYIGHDEALLRMMESDVLLLFWAPGASTVGGKTYEYLRSERCILGFEQGNVDGPSLVRRMRRGLVVPIASKREIKDALRSLLDKKLAGAPLLSEPLEDVSEYSRDTQNRNLLAIVRGEV